MAEGVVRRGCGVCGAAVRAPFQAPAPELSPDLDLRPGEPTRSTLGRWVQVCRGCGAAAADLVRLPGRARIVVESATYGALRGPAAPFVRFAMLCDAEEVAGVTLQGAWALDDAGLDGAALRLRAAGLWGDGATVEDGLRALDALRRAGALAEAEALRARLAVRPGLEETDRLVLEYQRRVIEAGDTGRHLMSSAVRPPAQRPHVTHGRAEKRGFWQRLAGG